MKMNKFTMHSKFLRYGLLSAFFCNNHFSASYMRYSSSGEEVIKTFSLNNRTSIALNDENRYLFAEWITYLEP